MLWKPWASSVALCLALSSAAHAAETVITPEARGHFQAGVAFVEDPDGARFEEAYREFKIAYSLSPAWKILGNLGLVALKLERDGEPSPHTRSTSKRAVISSTPRSALR